MIQKKSHQEGLGRIIYAIILPMARKEDTPISQDRPRDRFWQEVQLNSFRQPLIIRSCFEELRQTTDQFLKLNDLLPQGRNPVLVNRSGKEESYATKYPDYEPWQIFATTREGIQHIDAPTIECEIEKVDGKDRFFIIVRPTGDARSRYGNAVLPGIGKIDLYSNGEILGGDLFDPKPTEPLTDEEIEELTLVFTRAQDSLRDSIANMKKANVTEEETLKR